MAAMLRQSDKKAVFGVDSSTLAFPSNVVAGNTLVATIAGFHSPGGFTCETPTDSQGNTWTAAVAQQTSGNGGIRTYWAKAGTSGANTVTFSGNTASDDLTIVISEWVGLLVQTPSATPVDNAIDDTGAGTTATADPLSTSTGPCVIYGGLSHLSSTRTLTQTDTIIQEIEDATGMPISTQYRFGFPISSTYDSVWTIGTGSVTWIANVVAFKIAPTMLASVGAGI